MTARTISLRYAGTCGDCGTALEAGTLAQYGGRGRIACVGCDLENVPAGPTTRERREARAERLREWADSRETKGAARLETAGRIADMIPMGQPILVGHHSEGRHRRDLARIDSNMRAGIADTRKAENMRSRADNIEAAAGHAIYSDDPDACDRLRERIAELDAERARWTAYNAACRKQKGCTAEALALLDDRQRRQIAGGTFARRYGQTPAYVLENLSGNLSRQRQRLARLERHQS